MSVVLFRSTSDLTAEEKTVVEKLVGRPLADDEVVNVRAFRARPAPIGRAKKEAARALKAQLDSLAACVKDVPAEHLDAALDEALKQVRPAYQSIHEDDGQASL